jgi:hypothetical protein
MKTYITTIEELQGKTRSELNAIFKDAAQVAATAALHSAEKEAAKRTMENIRRCLIQRDGP